MLISGLFKHPVFKLSFLKPQMKEKLDKNYVNLKKYDKSAALSLSPNLLSLIQPQMSLSNSMGGNNLLNSTQNQQMMLQNQSNMAQSLLQQQQQQALSKSLTQLGGNGLNQSLMAGLLGLKGTNLGLEKEAALNYLDPRGSLNALGLGGNYNSQLDLLKALSMSRNIYLL